MCADVFSTLQHHHQIWSWDRDLSTFVKESKQMWKKVKFVVIWTACGEPSYLVLCETTWRWKHRIWFSHDRYICIISLPVLFGFYHALPLLTHRTLVLLQFCCLFRYQSLFATSTVTSLKSCSSQWSNVNTPLVLRVHSQGSQLTAPIVCRRFLSGNSKSESWHRGKTRKQNSRTSV